jgi:hypothetical protein
MKMNDEFEIPVDKDENIDLNDNKINDSIVTKVKK